MVTDRKIAYANSPTHFHTPILEMLSHLKSSPNNTDPIIGQPFLLNHPDPIMSFCMNFESKTLLTLWNIQMPLSYQNQSFKVQTKEVPPDGSIEN